jgi:secondary thiamine-phosphate synthase enzyme
MFQKVTNGTTGVIAPLKSVLPGMVYNTTSLHFLTERGPQFIDITGQVQEFVARCGVEIGSVVVYSRHTTAAIKINENEPLLIEDMCERLGKAFPPNEYYRHNDFDIRTHNMTPDENPNGHSHCQHLMLSTSETIPILHGEMALGRWQRIFLVELDCSRPREVILLVSGQPRLGL